MADSRMTQNGTYCMKLTQHVACVGQLLNLLRTEAAGGLSLLETSGDRLMEFEEPFAHRRARRALLVRGIGAFP